LHDIQLIGVSKTRHKEYVVMDFIRCWYSTIYR